MALLLQVLGFFSLIGMGWASLFSNRLLWHFAPLLGMILLGSLAIFRINWILVPIDPWMDLLALTMISVLVFFARIKFAKLSAKEFLKQSFFGFNRFYVFMLVFFIFYADTFSRNGFEMLNGGQDEIQYALNADHMLHHQHRGGSLDSLEPRFDHWLHDFVTLDLPYNKSYRRAAETTLASVTAWTGVNTQSAFPLLVGIATFLTGIVAFWISKFTIRVRGVSRFILPLFLILGCYPFLLHLQGSLANILSLPMFLFLAGASPRLLTNRKLNSPILIGVLLAGTFLFYSETAFVFGLFPLLAVAGLCWLKFPRRRFVVFRNLSFALILSLLLGHQGFLTSYIHVKAQTSVMTPESSATSFWNQEKAFATAFNLGVISKSHDKAFNGEAAEWVALNLDWYGILCASLVALGFGNFFFARKKRFTTIGIWICFCLGLVIVASSLRLPDGLRIARSSGFLIPFLWSLLVLTPGRIRFLLIIPLFWQVRSTLASYSHVKNEDTQTEYIYRRLNRDLALWKDLRAALDEHPLNPVLISGFNDTVRPHGIISSIEPHANYLGEDILAFWRIFNENHFQKAEQAQGRFASKGYSIRPFPKRTDRDDQSEIEKIPFANVDEVIKSLHQKAVQALIPIDGAYPKVWGKWQDVFPPKRIRFKNVTDLIYKEEKTLWPATDQDWKSWTPLNQSLQRGRGLLANSNLQTNYDCSKGCSLHVRLRENADVTERELALSNAIRFERMGQWMNFYFQNPPKSSLLLKKSGSATITIQTLFIQQCEKPPCALPRYVLED